MERDIWLEGLFRCLLVDDPLFYLHRIVLPSLSVGDVLVEYNVLAAFFLYDLAQSRLLAALS